MYEPVQEVAKKLYANTGNRRIKISILIKLFPPYQIASRLYLFKNIVPYLPYIVIEVSCPLLQ